MKKAWNLDEHRADRRSSGFCPIPLLSPTMRALCFRNNGWCYQKSGVDLNLGKKHQMSLGNFPVLYLKNELTLALLSKRTGEQCQRGQRQAQPGLWETGSPQGSPSSLSTTCLAGVTVSTSPQTLTAHGFQGVYFAIDPKSRRTCSFSLFLVPTPGRPGYS